MGILMFGFASSMMVHVQTTAAPMVRSRWAGVKVLPQQLLLGHNLTELVSFISFTSSFLLLLYLN